MAKRTADPAEITKAVVVITGHGDEEQWGDLADKIADVVERHGFVVKNTTFGEPPPKPRLARKNGRGTTKATLGKAALALVPS